MSCADVPCCAPGCAGLSVAVRYQGGAVVVVDDAGVGVGNGLVCVLGVGAYGFVDG